VDNVISLGGIDPFSRQAADLLMRFLNDVLGLGNTALYTGLPGLQSAIYANPYFGTIWGQLAQAIAFDAAGGMFAGLFHTA
jgi:hypothetical protein